MFLAQVSNWTKQPTDPLFGVLGENVSLEWKFTLTGNDSISDFRLEQWHGFDQEDIVTYRPGKKVQVHPQFEGKFGFETNATHPAFILINAKTSDEAKYCCKVSTRKAYGGRSCTNLQILGKAVQMKELVYTYYKLTSFFLKKELLTEDLVLTTLGLWSFELCTSLS